MINSVLWSAFILALVTAAAPAWSGEQAVNDAPVLPTGSSQSMSAADDCETRMQKLDASQAEGAERLSEKYAVIEYCVSQYKSDLTIARLVKECARYVEQPVLKQQFFADCQLAAFNYANALRALKAEYRK